MTSVRIRHAHSLLLAAALGLPQLIQAQTNWQLTVGLAKETWIKR